MNIIYKVFVAFSAMDATNKTCTFPMQELGRLDGAHAIKHEGQLMNAIREFVNSEELQKKWNHHVADYVTYYKSK